MSSLFLYVVSMNKLRFFRLFIWKKTFLSTSSKMFSILRIQLEATVRGTLKQITKGNKRNLISFSSLGCKNWFSIFCESLGVSGGSRFHLQRCLARSNIRASACEWNLCCGYPAHFWHVYLIDQLEAVFETIHGPLVGPCWVTWWLCWAYARPILSKKMPPSGLMLSQFQPRPKKN